MLVDALVGLGVGMCVGGAGVYYWQTKIKAKMLADLERLGKMVQPLDGGPGVPKDPH